MCEYNPNGVARKRWNGQHLWNQKPGIACTHLLHQWYIFTYSSVKIFVLFIVGKFVGKTKSGWERLEEMEITQLPLSRYYYINLYYLDLEIKIHLLWPDFNFEPDFYMYWRTMMLVVPDQTPVHHKGAVHGQ